MTVFVVGYKGTNTDDILGVYSDIEMAKKVMHSDYEETLLGFVPDFAEIDDNHIFVANSYEECEWYIHETELR